MSTDLVEAETPNGMDTAENGGGSAIVRDKREDRLPSWAKQLIADLRKRIEFGHEPLIKELVSLRPKVASLKAKNDALTELLTLAAKGGHVASCEIIKVIEEYAPWKDEA